MKLVFSILILAVFFTGCCSPIAPLPIVPEVKVRYFISEDGTMVKLPMDDFSNWVSVTGKLRVNDTIYREASK